MDDRLQEGSVPQARELLEGYGDGILRVHPLLKTMIGDERFDDALPDPSPDG
jgi:hypothetical protein